MTPMCEAILSDPAASYWLKKALRSALKRDPVDAAADAEILAATLRARCDNIQRTIAEAVGFDLATLQEELWRDSDGP
jgi:transcription initiation factor TFIIIB Brf1 subunit/transcription initiation factor TFIIB